MQGESRGKGKTFEHLNGIYRNHVVPLEPKCNGQVERIGTFSQVHTYLYTLVHHHGGGPGPPMPVFQPNTSQVAQGQGTLFGGSATSPALRIALATIVEALSLVALRFATKLRPAGTSDLGLCVAVDSRDFLRSGATPNREFKKQTHWIGQGSKGWGKTHHTSSPECIGQTRDGDKNGMGTKTSWGFHLRTLPFPS